MMRHNKRRHYSQMLTDYYNFYSMVPKAFNIFNTVACCLHYIQTVFGLIKHSEHEKSLEDKCLSDFMMSQQRMICYKKYNTPIQ